MNIKLKPIKTWGKKYKDGDGLDFYIDNIKLGWAESRVKENGEELFKFHSSLFLDVFDEKGIFLPTREVSLDEIKTAIELTLKESLKKILA